MTVILSTAYILFYTRNTSIAKYMAYDGYSVMYCKREKLDGVWRTRPVISAD